MDNLVMVSVFVIAYNQKEYIKQTLDSIISQRTSFKFEILVNDDCSTDGTREIIQQYARTYPQVVFPCYHDENMYSKGVNINKEFNYPRARGKYIAMCEGDDYWSDDLKLQSQFDALENNIGCSICVHNTVKITANGTITDKKFPVLHLKDGILKGNEIIHIELVENPWLFHTSSFFIRKNVYDTFIKQGFVFADKFPVGDKPLFMFCLISGDVYYVDKDMSCYRTNSGGVVTKISNDTAKHLEYDKKFIEGYKAFDAFTRGKYHEDLEFIEKSKMIHSCILRGEFKKTLNRNYKMAFRKLKLKYKIAIYVGSMFPEMVKQLISCRNKK